MSIYQRLVNFNQLFARLDRPAIIINDVSTDTEEERDDLSKKIYTTYKEGVMNTVAKCDCGSIQGDFNIGRYCDSCNTVVESPIYQDLQPLLWIRSPEGIKALINPHVWLLLKRAFSVNKSLSLPLWIADSSYKPESHAKEITILKEMGIQRGYNYFVENFWDIINKLASMKTFSSGTKAQRTQLVLRVLNEYKDCIFCNYLPLPNRLVLVLEEAHTAKYMDEAYSYVINAVQMIASIDIKKKHKVQEPKAVAVDSVLGMDYPEELERPEVLVDSMSLARKECRVAKMLDGLTEFYNKYYNNNFAKKPGIFRKHLLSSRAHFSARCVITSNTDIHEYDELHIPWTTAIAIFRYHILNKLYKRGYGYHQSLKLINHYARIYEPTLDEILTELIEEAQFLNPDTKKMETGIPCSFVRNPSLGRGSCIRLRITQVIKDPKVMAMRLSILAVKSLNADFDGDACGIMLFLDEYMTHQMQVHKGYYNVFDLSSPRQISDVMAIPKPVISNINRWYYGKDEGVGNMQAYLA